MSENGKPKTPRIATLAQLDTASSRFPVLDRVEAYWTSLRRDGALPLRSEIDPRGLERALSTCFILERLAPGVARFRLSGSHLNDLLGMEVRGMSLTAFFLPEARARVGEALAQVFDTPAAARLTLAGDRGIHRRLADGCRADVAAAPQ